MKKEKEHKKFINKIEKPFNIIDKGLSFKKSKGKKLFKGEGLRF